ncbi:MAG TPA: NADH-quinone oxidoreductase subunit A [Syntrophorhabdaceae bacterium]|jgi:NADH-quinone oxidoreductase subunit A
MFEYVAIFVMFCLAGIIATVIIGASHLLGQRTQNRIKLAPYECGTTTIGPTRRIMTIRYYIVAMLFLVFDIEVIFLYPWAVVTKKLGLFGFVEMMVFVLILFIGYIYIWKKGALEWE